MESRNFCHIICTFLPAFVQNLADLVPQFRRLFFLVIIGMCVSWNAENIVGFVKEIFVKSLSYHLQKRTQYTYVVADVNDSAEWNLTLSYTVFRITFPFLEFCWFCQKKIHKIFIRSSLSFLFLSNPLSHFQGFHLIHPSFLTIFSANFSNLENCMVCIFLSIKNMHELNRSRKLRFNPKI